MKKSAKPTSPKYKRIVLKLSGEALQGRLGSGIDPAVLESLARQVGPPFEVVAVDDRAGEISRAALERRAATDPRFRLVESPSPGLVAALNAGLQTCRAPLVLRMDADDVAHPERVARQVEIFRELYNIAWQDNWGFTPMTHAEARWMAKHLKPLLVPSLALIAEVERCPIGFLILLPDYNQVLRHLNGRLGPVGLLKFLWYRRRIRDARLILLGVRPEYRGKGVDALLYFFATRALNQRGFIHAEISWVLEDNWIVLRLVERWGGVPYKRYRIYELPL
jgi:glycosyltransferase involved in cell wall biosynthesis